VQNFNKITSQHNDRIKLVRSLQMQPKARRTEEKIVLEGTRLISDAMQGGAVPSFVLVTEEASAAGSATGTLLEQLQRVGTDVYEISQDLLLYVSDTHTPQGLLAVFPMPKLDVPTAVKLALILDGVSDPGNFGTILRTAAAAGVEIVVLAPGSVDPFNPKTLRGGMGAHFRLPIRRLTWGEIADHYGALPLYIADAQGTKEYSAVDWKQPAALIIGSEAHGAGGVSENLPDLELTSIRIPMTAGAESLNAAMATGVILFEAMRQRSI